MKINKILTVALTVLFICFIIQTMYVLRLKDKEHVSNNRRFAGFTVQKHPFFSKPFGGLVNNHDNDFGSFFDGNHGPFKDMEKMQAVINRMFRDSISRIRQHGGLSLKKSESFFIPDADIQDIGKKYVIKVDIPGMSKTKIDVEVENNQLVVSGKRKEEAEENTNKAKSSFYVQERSFGYFSRVIPLPSDARDRGITADYKKGILTVIIPKRDIKKFTETGRRKINVL